MGSVQKRERNGTVKYRARIRGLDGRERSKTFARKVDADRWITAQERAKDVGDWTDPAAGRGRYGEWQERWWRTRQGRPSTLARDESYLRNHILPAFAATPIGGIRQPDVVEWVHELEGKGLAPATVHKIYQIFAASIQAAVDARMIPASPCVKVPLPKIERSEMRFLNPVEVQQLAEAIDPKYRALVLAAAYGGFRIGELSAMRPTRMLPATKQLEVAETVVWVRGHPVFGPPKSAAGQRRVTLPGSVWDELVAHARSHATEFLFPSPEGGPLRSSNFRRRAWASATEATGFSGLRPHDLRHTAVSLWIASGANVKAVSMRAGHTSVSFTLDRYGHLYPDQDAALAARLDDMIPAANDNQVVQLHG